MQPCLLLSTKSTKSDSSDSSYYSSQYHSGLIVPRSLWTVRTTTRSYPPWIIRGNASTNPGANIAFVLTTVPEIHESLISGEELLYVSTCNLRATILQFLLSYVLQFCVLQFLQFLASCKPTSCNPANLRTPPSSTTSYQHSASTILGEIVPWLPKTVP
jgi:hypothetical protein